MSSNPSVTTQKPRRFRASLAWNMMAILLPITIIPTLLMGITVYNRGRNLLLQQISERMDIFLTEAINQMDSWLLVDKYLALNSLSNNPEFISTVGQFLQTNQSDTEYQQYHDQVLKQLRSMNPVGQEALFNHIFLLDPQGHILVSTTRIWEGETLSGQSYFQNKIQTEDKAHFVEISPFLI